jgi:signal peptidase I
MRAAAGAASIMALAGLAALIWLIRRRIAVVSVVGDSMLPSLAEGDRVLVRRVRIGDLRIGQIVVFERPGTAGGWTTDPPGWPVGGREWMIKRVAALPGDLRPDTYLPPAKDDSEDSVPSGNLVVLGDNHAGSYDSRQVGYIPADRLVGVVLRPLAYLSRDAT